MTLQRAYLLSAYQAIHRSSPAPSPKRNREVSLHLAFPVLYQGTSLRVSVSIRDLRLRIAPTLQVKPASIVASKQCPSPSSDALGARVYGYVYLALNFDRQRLARDLFVPNWKRDRPYLQRTWADDGYRASDGESLLDGHVRPVCLSISRTHPSMSACMAGRKHETTIVHARIQSIIPSCIPPPRDGCASYQRFS